MVDTNSDKPKGKKVFFETYYDYINNKTKQQKDPKQHVKSKENE